MPVAPLTLIAFLTLSVWPNLAFAQGPAAEAPSIAEEELVLNPKMCLGYNHDSEEWGPPTPDAIRRRLCPADSALYGMARAWTESNEPSAIAIIAVCCPLPDSEILTDNHQWVESQCPSQSMVTGYDAGTTDSSGRFVALLRCTEINQQRFRLAAAHTGAFWGSASSAAMPWKENVRLMRTALPPAIRYGIERLRHGSPMGRGCVGQPIGSVFVGKLGRYCRSMLFSQLFAKSESTGRFERPVRMFPKCSYVVNPFDETAQCIP